MQGSYNDNTNHYRCKFSSERAPIPGVDHPKNVYVRESAIVPKLDEWIGSLFDPANLDETCASLAAAGGATEADHARIEAAGRKLADRDSRLTKYRRALEARVDPVVMAGWMSEVQGERLRAGTGDRRGAACGERHDRAGAVTRRGHHRHGECAGRGRPEAQSPDL